MLAYYHGRAKLSTWLRSVLAQRHVDVARTRHRLQPLGLESAETAADGGGEASRASTLIGADGPNDEPDRARYVAACRHALQAALLDLDAGERLRLSCYYVQELKLAEIGRLFGEHEATVSRKLSRARKRVRAEVERVLNDRHRLTPAQIELCYQYIVEESPVDLADILESDG